MTAPSSPCSTTGRWRIRTAPAETGLRGTRTNVVSGSYPPECPEPHPSYDLGKLCAYLETSADFTSRCCAATLRPTFAWLRGAAGSGPTRDLPVRNTIKVRTQWRLPLVFAIGSSSESSPRTILRERSVVACCRWDLFSRCKPACGYGSIVQSKSMRCPPVLSRMGRNRK